MNDYSSNKTRPASDASWETFQAALRRANDQIEPSDALRDRLDARLEAMRQAEPPVTVAIMAGAWWTRAGQLSAVAAALLITATLAWLVVPRGPLPTQTHSTDATALAATTTPPRVIVAMADSTQTITRPIESSRPDITIVWMHPAYTSNSSAPAQQPTPPTVNTNSET